MNVTNIVRGVVNATKMTVTAPIIKEDYGLYLKIEGLDLPTVYEVDFSNSETGGTSVTMVGNADGVLIPRQLIKSGQDVFAFLYWNGEDFGRTVYKFRIPNKLRPDRTEEQPTPEEQSLIDQAISALNSAVEQTAEDVETTTAKAAEATSAAATATQKASEATESAQSAGTYATRAETAQNAAESARTASQQSATASATSAEQAAGSALTASTKAGDASASATSAAQSALDARDYKDAANLSAESASGYAGSASDSATTATEQATIATNKAEESAQSALDATTAQGLAEDARDEAQRIVDGIVMIEDTASGAVASFPDGADNFPMKSLKVAIDPVQDLHGQESPYPAGGGINLLDFDGVISEGWTNTLNGITATYSKGYLKVTGTNTSSGYTDIVSFRTAWSNNRYEFGAGSYTMSEHVAIVCSVDGGSDVNKTWAFSAETSVSVRGFYVTVSGGQTVDWNIPMMFVKGTTTPTVYSPYANICPIEGWTGAQVVRTGKNLLDKTAYSYIGHSNVVWGATSSNTWADGSFVLPAGTYTFSCSEAQTGMYVSDNEKQIAVKYTAKFISFTLSETTPIKLMTYWSGHNAEEAMLLDYQLEYGTTQTAYEPYTGNTYSVSWQTEAGTVYGGTLDVVSGELVVDRMSVDLGTLYWLAPISANPNWFRVTDADWRSSIKSRSILCSVYGNVLDSSTSSALNNAPDKSITVNIGNNATDNHPVGTLLIKDTAYNENVSAFKSAMDGVQLVYELAEPQTYHLTPTEVRTLLGQNNVWADTGDSMVEYYADTKRYIDKKIAELG